MMINNNLTLLKNIFQIFVIIPVYNCERFLYDSVNSVLNQKLDNLEIILVDDGSTDMSSVLCDNISKMHKNIVVIHKENGGVSNARNTGIEYVMKYLSAKTKGYFAFLDADDVWSKDFFNEEVIEDLSRDFDIVGYQSCKCIHDLTRCSFPAKVSEGIYTNVEELKNEYYSQHFGAAFYSCELLRDYSIKFDDGLKFGEDTIFKTKCYVFSTRALIREKVFYLYRENRFSVFQNRTFGMEYYVPMFNHWLMFDDYILRYKKEERKYGFEYVSWYILDMCKEHYQKFGRRKELVSFFNKNDIYINIVKTYPRYKNIMKHPILFQFQNYCIGILNMIICNIKRMPMVKKIWVKRKYHSVNRYV